MKTIKHLLLLSIVLITVSGCNSNDDGFYNETYVDAVNLVSIETQQSYQLNDVLYINSRIPRLLPQVNSQALLDVRKSTGNAESFSFNIVLEKRDANGEWNYVEVGNNFVVDQGDAIMGSIVQGILDYESPEEHYFFRGGLRLTSVGDYRVTFSNNNAQTSKIELRSNSTGNNLRMNISTTTTSFNQSGSYTFTVN